MIMKKIFLSLLAFLWLFSFSFADSINVFYNWFNDVESFTCDWDISIYLDWNYNFTESNSLFTPYFDIDYKDEDNQLLTESYDKSILYLSGWNFKKTYTWDNERILTYQVESSSDTSIVSYTPVFEITWSIDENSWNVFNNFSDNALTFLLSNIPSYIQRITLFAVLMLILWIIRRFKR